MPGVVTMKQRGTCSKAMARVKEERGLGALLSQVRFSPGKKGRRPTDLQALGTRSNLAMKLRTKLLCEARDDVEKNENVSGQCEQKNEPSSVRLAAMVDEFLEDGTNDRKRGRSRFDDGSGEEEPKSSLRDELAAILYENVSTSEKILLGEVNNAVNVGDGDSSSLHRHVFRHLRRAGFNVGLCKSRWDHSGGFPAGDYEYIDVLFEDSSGRCERILIDVGFKAQFEVARPTAHYGALVQALPSAFVGTADQIHKIVDVMSEAVKLSLKKRGMHLPPWRKLEYMRAKWLASYKRKTKWQKSIDGNSDSGSEVCDVSPVADANVKSSRMVPEPWMSEENPVVKKPNIGNRFATGQGVGTISNSIDNNDWHLPSLEAKKSPGPRHAGLASLFRKPVSSLQEGTAKGPGGGA